MVVHIAEACYLQLSAQTIKLTPRSLLGPRRLALTAPLFVFVLFQSLVFLSVFCHFFFSPPPPQLSVTAPNSLHLYVILSVFLSPFSPSQRSLSPLSLSFLALFIFSPLLSWFFFPFFLFTFQSLFIFLQTGRPSLFEPPQLRVLVRCVEKVQNQIMRWEEKGPGTLAFHGGGQQICVTVLFLHRSLYHLLANIMICWLTAPTHAEEYGSAYVSWKPFYAPLTMTFVFPLSVLAVALNIRNHWLCVVMTEIQNKHKHRGIAPRQHPLVPVFFLTERCAVASFVSSCAICVASAAERTEWNAGISHLILVLYFNTLYLTLERTTPSWAHQQL